MNQKFRMVRVDVDWPDDVYALLKKQSKENKMSLSRYVAYLIERDIKSK